MPPHLNILCTNLVNSTAPKITINLNNKVQYVYAFSSKFKINAEYEHLSVEMAFMSTLCC